MREIAEGIGHQPGDGASDCGGVRAEGLGFDRIAARLNAEQAPTRTGRPWHGVVVNRILGR